MTFKSFPGKVFSVEVDTPCDKQHPSLPPFES